MGTGISICQNGCDNEILALKSSDVTHGFTCPTEADSYGTFGKGHNTSGGLKIAGWASRASALELNGSGEPGNSTNSGSGYGSISTYSQTRCGVGVDSLGACENMIAFRNNGTTYAIIKGDGDIYTATGSITDAWDEYCDVALLSAARGIMTSCANPDFKQSLTSFVDEYACVLEQTHVLTLNRGDGLPFMSYKGMFGLIIDTIRQVNGKVVGLETQLKALSEGK